MCQVTGRSRRTVRWRPPAGANARWPSQTHLERGGRVSPANRPTAPHAARQRASRCAPRVTGRAAPAVECGDRHWKGAAGLPIHGVTPAAASGPRRRACPLAGSVSHCRSLLEPVKSALEAWEDVGDRDFALEVAREGTFGDVGQDHAHVRCPCRIELLYCGSGEALYRGVALCT